MLGIILIIFKTLGIIILSILALLLFLILLILFVPIRYKSSNSFYESKKGYIVISYLFYILHVKITYNINEKKNDVIIRIFGINIKKRNSKHNANKKEDKETNKNSEIKNSNRIQEIDITQQDSSKQQLDIEQESNTIEEIKYDKKHQEELKKIENNLFENESEGFFEKILNKFKSIFNKILNVFKSIINKIKSLVKVLKDFYKNISVWKEFLLSDNSKKTYSLMKQELIVLLKHIRPKKLKAYVCYGTGDPATTGEALALISMFYGKISKNVTIVPDFENKKLEGDIFLKGRIYTFKLLVIGIKVYFNKNFKYFIKNIPGK